MVSKEMARLGTERSVIREIFEIAKVRNAEVGEENVIDFSIGNPSVPAPKQIQDTIRDFLDNLPPKAYHSYTSSVGDNGTRTAIANNLNKRFGTDYDMNNLFMTCGSAASLTICFKAIITSPDDEIIVFIPFFPEYKVYIEGQGAKMVLVDPDKELNIDLNLLEKAINKNTKALVINSPNNPAGIIYPESNLKAVADLLNRKSKEYGHAIYIITDEPYRELVYTDEKVAHIPSIYDNTLVCYSWSKSISLPGERIGYVLVPNQMEDSRTVYAAVGGAARTLGYICAPSLFQKVIEKCVDVEPDISVYRKNREILLKGLKDAGYHVANPGGAFYLFVEAPEKDGEKFYERAKKYDLLIVPGASFGSKEYVRLAYCIDTEKIEKSIPIFKKLMDEYKS